jgi:hypothetical protein
MSSGRRLTIAGAATLVGALGLTGAAHARITVNRSVAGVGLGMTAKEVRAKLGRPSVASVSDGSRNLVYRPRALVVTLIAGRVVMVSTRNRRERTVAGVGVGATAAAVRHRVSGVRCGEHAGVGFCRVGSVRPGRRSTTFQIEAGRVVTVTVARGLR